MRNLEKLWVILCEVQSQLEIFLLFILGQSKPIIIETLLSAILLGAERINVRLHVAREPSLAAARIFALSILEE
jgi:hypothetical protein